MAIALVIPHPQSEEKNDRAFFEFPGGEVMLMTKDKSVLTVERAIFLLECTKARLLKGLGVVD